MRDGRRRVPNNSWLDGLNGKSPKKPRPLLERGGFGRKVRPGIVGGGRNWCNVWLIVAFEEGSETTHFREGVEWEFNT